jgi:hypothetical protein
LPASWVRCERGVEGVSSEILFGELGVPTVTENSLRSGD